jgi:hypothetical protein
MPINTWLHSALVIAAGAIALAVPISLQVWPLAPGSAAGLPATLAMLALLLPGLAIGWFTRRHPLLVGGAAGLAGVVLAGRLPGAATTSIPSLDTALAAGLVVAVAALAGRALRWRLRPAGATP